MQIMVEIHASTVSESIVVHSLLSTCPSHVERRDEAFHVTQRGKTRSMAVRTFEWVVERSPRRWMEIVVRWRWDSYEILQSKGDPTPMTWLQDTSPRRFEFLRVLRSRCQMRRFGSSGPGIYPRITGEQHAW